MPAPPFATTAAFDARTLVEIAAGVGTPCYVYDARTIRARYAALDAAFGAYPHAVHYALKANSNLTLVRLVRSLGGRADANSMGEVAVALRAGFAPRDIVFTGVGKTADELDRAVTLGLHAVNVESPGELDRLAARAEANATRARVALRVTPDIDADSHPHITTGLSSTKFGVPIAEAPALFREMCRRPSLVPVGVHVHIGSQVTSLAPLVASARAAVALACALGAEGIRLEHVDLGGGLGISYDGGPVADPSEYAQALVAAVRPSGLPLLVEPGRVLMGPAGVLLARVVDVKQFPGTPRFVVLDAGMTELMRPALYAAYHAIEPVARREGRESPADVVGPICEMTDTFARGRLLPPLEVGDLVVIRDVGAYGAAMGHAYLRRPLAPEVLVDEERWRIIRRRQTLDELVRLEEGLEDLRA